MKNVTLFFLYVSSMLFVYGQEKDPLDKKIQKMMEVTGTSQRFEVIMDNLIDSQKENNLGSVDVEFWNLFKQEVKTNGTKEIMELLLPIYRKHLTESEIDGITAFYQSETGQSMVRKFPLIAQESKQAGEKWGEKLGKQILQKIEDSDELKFNIVLDDCSAFKDGKFIYKLPNGTKATIIRKGDLQREMAPDGELKAKIEWVTRCSYNLWKLDENNKVAQPIPLEVNIYEINENSYKYISRMEGYDLNVKGELQKIED